MEVEPATLAAAAAGQLHHRQCALAVARDVLAALGRSGTLAAACAFRKDALERGAMGDGNGGGGCLAIAMLEATAHAPPVQPPTQLHEGEPAADEERGCDDHERAGPVAELA